MRREQADDWLKLGVKKTTLANEADARRRFVRELRWQHVDHQAGPGRWATWCVSGSGGAFRRVGSARPVSSSSTTVRVIRFPQEYATISLLEIARFTDLRVKGAVEQVGDRVQKFGR